MPDEVKQAPDFPKSPHERLKEPETPKYEKDSKVTIFGFIGAVTEHFVHLHHMHDYRAYYRIPREGIASCQPEPSTTIEGLHKLEIFEHTPIRYFHATTVDLTAGTLAHAIATYNKYGKRPAPKGELRQLVGDKMQCPPNCQICHGGVCVPPPPGFPIEEAHAEMFGLVISIPAFPQKP
jgi:hypothetical protein